MDVEPLRSDPSGRDLIGWGRHLPAVRWPGNARVAVSIVVNYEEGSEYSIVDGDRAGEQTAELGSRMPADRRDIAVESTFDYGSRAGIWRLQRIIDRAGVPATVFGTAIALQRHPEVAQWLSESIHEPCPHGLRWEDPWALSEDDERAHMRDTVDWFRTMFGSAPRGWYCRYGPSERTRRLLLEHGGFLYDSDSYSDDVPYFVQSELRATPHVVVPYSLATNDIRFVSGSGPYNPRDFFELLRGSLDYLLSEPDGSARMMSVGLHCRIAGQPGRAVAVRDFIDYATQQDNVWIARREDIAAHWLANCAPVPPPVTPPQTKEQPC
jgi:peptidoglycan/xylan/chitin deacetylase (PgdA/CDA1 family)